MAEEMDKLRLSLGIEAQNSRLAQKVEGYEQLTRQQDVKIRQLQRMLSQAGVRVYADGNKVRNFASGLLRDYGAQRIQGLDRRKITDARDALYNSMANDGASRDAATIQAGLPQAHPIQPKNTGQSVSCPVLLFISHAPACR